MSDTIESSNPMERSSESPPQDPTNSSPEDDLAGTAEVKQGGSEGPSSSSGEGGSEDRKGKEDGADAEDRDGDEEDEEDEAAALEREAAAAAAAEEEEHLATVGIAANEVKNIILQMLSPYFDDEGGAGPTGTVEADMTASPTTRDETSAGAANASAAAASGGDEGNGNGGTSTSAAAPLVPAFLDEEEDTAQRYDHTKSASWVQLICDGITERLVAMGKPYKFITHLMVMRKCGAGMHICSSNYYSQTDGWLSHAHDMSPHIYCVVTVYWMAI